jgi:hypothetical protein
MALTIDALWCDDCDSVCLLMLLQWRWCEGGESLICVTRWRFAIDYANQPVAQQNGILGLSAL